MASGKTGDVLVEVQLQMVSGFAAVNSLSAAAESKP